LRILGIDPGYETLGFGLIELNGTDWEAVDYGVITTDSGDAMPDRLLQIYEDLQTLFEDLSPDIVSMEDLFFCQNITSGLQVAEARGVIQLVVAEAGLPLYEYKPNEVKLCITGYGQASKSQMQKMAQEILNLSSIPTPDDAADALCIALTCAFDRVRV